VNVWTVNDPERMDVLLRWGVQGIITDRPDLALERLRAADLA
jgi:glycerophosphoryl diester phosphodiesterase